jgi:hypothetical protein
MKLKLCAVMLSGCVIFPAAAQAKDAPASNMLTESYFDTRRNAEQKEIQLLTVSAAEFKSAYRAAGNPKVVFLLGENFSGLVSDWYSDTRLSLNSAATGTTGTFVPESQHVTVEVEQRVAPYGYRSSLLNAEQWNEYERGYRNTLLRYGVKMINRNLAMRLLDSEIRATSKRNPQSDSQRLEMDMLRKHSQVIVEVIPYRETRHRKEGIGYDIAVTSLDDASIIADNRIAIPEAYLEYRAGASGYSKQRPQNFADVEAGSSGYDIIEDPIEIWVQQGELAAQATLQLLYDSWLAK